MIVKSVFGEHLSRGSGIEELMKDLGHAMAESLQPIRMLGGGNPALIPKVQDFWRRRMRQLLDDGDRFDRMMTVYDPPKGNTHFILAMTDYLRERFAWDIGPENIVVTAGGQAAFFNLFNLLAGRMKEGIDRKILVPMLPEYIGYAGQGIGEDFFRGVMPRIQHTQPHRFKYRVDFESLEINNEIGAVCASRPTNPSGNVLTDGEVEQLDKLCRQAGIPLVLDHAYGSPFPGILFREIRPVWNPNTVTVLSLSKLGLPGTRTAVVVAAPEIVDALVSMIAVSGLANGNVGQAILLPLIESREIDRIVADIIRPFYVAKAAFALDCVSEFFDDTIDYHVHENEGALFLWMWFRNLPISSMQLYERLKHRGVLVVPGRYFAYGCPEAEVHADQCLRISYAMSNEVVREGMEIIADEVRKAYR